MRSFFERVKDVEKHLSKISPTLCMAKWYQVTLHLQNGFNHSCHHPNIHKIPLEELELDVSALHNTSFKKKVRLQMLQGERPRECSYCWDIEDLGQISDRLYKSSYDWAYGKLASGEFASIGNPADENVFPSSMEVSFESTCNFKCAYCSPTHSTKWQEEIAKFGAYPDSNRFNNLQWIDNLERLPLRGENPYIVAFWKWWPDLVKNLFSFRITGGEPLLSKQTFKVLDYIIENPQPHLSLAVNTNGDVPQQIWDNFLIKVSKLEGKVKQFTLYTSMDTAIAEQAEYIRYGLKLSRFQSNIEQYLRRSPPSFSISFMITVSNLGIFGLKDLLLYILQLRSLFGGPRRVRYDTPYITYPRFLSLNILSPSFVSYLEDALGVARHALESCRDQFDKDRVGFEYQRLLRVYELMVQNSMKADIDGLKNKLRRDLVLFVDEYDRRRQTHFLKTFPELKDLYHEAKESL